jgi:hypothetical protein
VNCSDGIPQPTAGGADRSVLKAESFSEPKQKGILCEHSRHFIKENYSSDIGIHHTLSRWESTEITLRNIQRRLEYLSIWVST